MQYIKEGIEWAALCIEIMAVTVIVAGVLVVAVKRGTVRFLRHIDEPGAFESYKQQMGRPLLLGLDLLVAGDVVRTVALQPTTSNISALGLLILVRIGLSWSLVVEMNGCWPWQEHAAAKPEPQPRPVNGNDGGAQPADAVRAGE